MVGHWSEIPRWEYPRASDCGPLTDSCSTADISKTCAEGQHLEESVTRAPLEFRKQHSKRFINIKFFLNEL